jgi:hypothetical protein
MTSLAHGQAVRPASTVSGRPAIPPHPPAAPPESGRAAARASLEDALAGVELSAADRRFLARLIGWDKRTAASIASLLRRARQSGRHEAALSPKELETVLAALTDAFAFRTSGSSAAGCWDCADLASGLCAEHEKDAGRAHAFAELATALSSRKPPSARKAQDGRAPVIPLPTQADCAARRRPLPGRAALVRTR